MYNKLKEKPKVFPKSQNRAYRPATSVSRKSDREIKIDAILDRISASGWNSLTDAEKDYLRSQSR
jgi:hypothetical protein